jgi:epidermal growth factor receptor substrate 15
MHLVYKALEKYAIPSILPPELMPPGKRKDIMPRATSPIPINIAAISTASISPSLQSSSIPSLPNTTTMKSLTALDAAKVFIF